MGSIIFPLFCLLNVRRRAPRLTLYNTIGKNPFEERAKKKSAREKEGRVANSKKWDKDAYRDRQCLAVRADELHILRANLWRNR